MNAYSEELFIWVRILRVINCAGIRASLRDSRLNSGLLEGLPRCLTANRLGPNCCVDISNDRPAMLPLAVVVNVIVAGRLVWVSILGLAVLLVTMLILLWALLVGLTIAMGTLRWTRLVVRRFLNWLNL